MPDRSSKAPPDPETVRATLIAAALVAYYDAGLSGLCAEGRWEAAVGAMRNLDLKLLGSGTRRGDVQQQDVPDDTGVTRGA